MILIVEDVRSQLIVDSIAINIKNIPISWSRYRSDRIGSSSTSGNDTINVSVWNAVSTTIANGDSVWLILKSNFSDTLFLLYNSQHDGIDSLYYHSWNDFQRMNSGAHTIITLSPVKIQVDSDGANALIDNIAMHEADFYYSYSRKSYGISGSYETEDYDLKGFLIETSSISIELIHSPPKSQVSDLLLNSKELRAFPNPASNMLTVKFKDVNTMVEVFDQLGSVNLSDKSLFLSETIHINTLLCLFITLRFKRATDGPNITIKCQKI